MHVGTAQRPPEMRSILFDEDDQLRKSVVVVVDGAQISDPPTFVIERDHDIFVMTPIAGG